MLLTLKYLKAPRCSKHQDMTMLLSNATRCHEITRSRTEGRQRREAGGGIPAAVMHHWTRPRRVGNNNIQSVLLDTLPYSVSSLHLRNYTHWPHTGRLLRQRSLNLLQSTFAWKSTFGNESWPSGPDNSSMPPWWTYHNIREEPI